LKREIVLSTSQSKRLIGRGLARWPPIRERLERGTILITKGTTNRYVAEEILGESLQDHRFAWGLVVPPGTPRHGDDIPEIIIVDGKRTEMEYGEAVDRLSPGDIYVKGGNALHYPTRTVGVLSSSPVGGTIGRSLPRVIGSRVRLVIPVGLEKCVPGPIEDISRRMNDPGPGTNGSTMYVIRGEVFTEIEALDVLTGATATHVASGGVLGYDGAVRLVVTGDEEEIRRVETVEKSLKDEPPYDYRK
jgi:hypothetical protein